MTNLERKQANETWESLYQHNKEKLYHLAIQACDNWHAELEKQFGKRAGDVRYTRQGQGASGTELNALYLDWVTANENWVKGMRENKNV